MGRVVRSADTRTCASRDAIMPSTKTLRATGTAIRSSDSLSALSRTTFQNNSMASSDCPWPRSQRGHGQLLVFRLRCSAAEAVECRCDGQPILCSQESQSPEGWRQVERGGQPSARSKPMVTPIRRNEVECVVPRQGIVQAQLPAEGEEVRAAAQRDVLASVEPQPEFRVVKRSGTAAEVLPPFEEFHLATVFRQCDGRGHAGQPAANDANVGRSVGWQHGVTFARMEGWRVTAPRNSLHSSRHARTSGCNLAVWNAPRKHNACHDCQSGFWRLWNAINRAIAGAGRPVAGDLPARMA